MALFLPVFLSTYLALNPVAAPLIPRLRPVLRLSHQHHTHHLLEARHRASSSLAHLCSSPSSDQHAHSHSHSCKHTFVRHLFEHWRSAWTNPELFEARQKAWHESHKHTAKHARKAGITLALERGLVKQRPLPFRMAVGLRAAGGGVGGVMAMSTFARPTRRAAHTLSRRADLPSSSSVAAAAPTARDSFHAARDLAASAFAAHARASAAQWHGHGFGPLHRFTFHRSKDIWHARWAAHIQSLAPSGMHYGAEKAKSRDDGDFQEYYTYDPEVVLTNIAMQRAWHDFAREYRRRHHHYRQHQHHRWHHRHRHCAPSFATIWRAFVRFLTRSRKAGSGFCAPGPGGAWSYAGRMGRRIERMDREDCKQRGAAIWTALRKWRKEREGRGEWVEYRKRRNGELALFSRRTAEGEHENRQRARFDSEYDSGSSSGSEQRWHDFNSGTENWEYMFSQHKQPIMTSRGVEQYTAPRQGMLPNSGGAQPTTDQLASLGVEAREEHHHHREEREEGRRGRGRKWRGWWRRGKWPGPDNWLWHVHHIGLTRGPKRLSPIMLADKQPSSFAEPASASASASGARNEHRQQHGEKTGGESQKAIELTAEDPTTQAVPAEADECGIRVLTARVKSAREYRLRKRAELRRRSKVEAIRVGAPRRAREQEVAIVALAKFVGRLVEGKTAKELSSFVRATNGDHRRASSFTSLLSASPSRPSSPNGLRRSYSTTSASSLSSLQSRSSSLPPHPKIVSVAQHAQPPCQRPLHTLPLIRDLKSSSMLRYIAPVSRLALSLVPALRILATYLGGSGGSAKARFVLNLSGALVVIPAAILLALWTAGLELTPLTGRLRAIYLNRTEEEDLVQALLSVGKPAEADAEATRETDWEQVLRFVIGRNVDGEEEEEMLLGGRVINAAEDWRVQWVESTLARLEDSMFDSDYTGEESEISPAVPYQLVPTETDPLIPRGEMPFISWQETCSPSATKVIGRTQRYSVILIDRPEKNAFSFGFGPRAFKREGVKGAELRNEGVIVVFSGFLDDILARDADSMLLQQQEASSVDCARSGPSTAQTSWLAVLLAHELGHLVLDHTLENYAGYPAIVPHLERLAGDVLRTALFPVTAVLGPFVNDAVARLLHKTATSHDDHDANSLTRLAGGCQSRTMELEADVVGLRLLANAGFDPYRALSFWEDRLRDRRGASPSTGSAGHHHHSVARMMHHSGPGGDWELSEKELELVRTHPVDEVRVGRIRQELEKWEEEGARLWAGAR